jgi:LEA14-like dessication related protein
MKPNFVLLALTLLYASSCKVLPPEYKGIQNPKVERIGLTGLKFGAEVTFYNPNRIKCRIQDVAMEVYIDNKQVGTIGEKADVEVKRKSEFIIPVGITLNPQGTIFENLTTIFEIFRDKETTLSLKGNVKVKVLGVTFPIPVRYVQQVKLSQIKGG